MIIHLKDEIDFFSKHKPLNLHLLCVSIWISAIVCMQNKIINLSDYPWYLLTL